MNYHEDDELSRLLDVFPLEKGQINISYINSTEHMIEVGFNTKNKLTYWICLKGSIKVGWALRR